MFSQFRRSISYASLCILSASSCSPRSEYLASRVFVMMKVSAKIVREGEARGNGSGRRTGATNRTNSWRKGVSGVPSTLEAATNDDIHTRNNPSLSTNSDKFTYIVPKLSNIVAILSWSAGNTFL